MTIAFRMAFWRKIGTVIYCLWHIIICVFKYGNFSSVGYTILFPDC